MAGLEQCLKQGPEQFGYLTGLWTLPRVGQLIEQQYGVCYDPSQVWRILRKLDWSCQRPTGQARERDEEAIRRWTRKRWPRLKKKALREGRIIVFLDESGLSERPIGSAPGRRGDRRRCCTITATARCFRRWPG